MVNIVCDSHDPKDIKVTQDGLEIKDILSIKITMRPNEPITAAMEIIVQEIDILAEETIKPINSQ